MSFAFRHVSLNNTAVLGVGSPSFERRDKAESLESGGLHQTGCGIIQTAPKASFTTVAVRSLISALTLDDEVAGVPYVELDGSNGCALIGGKAAAVPGMAAGSVHALRRLARGLAVLASLRWQRGNALEASIEVFGLSADGLVDPVAAGTVTLDTLYNTEQLGLSSLTNGAADIMPGVESFELAITHRVENNAADCYLGSRPHPVNLMLPGVAGATEIIATVETNDLTTNFANSTLAAAFSVLNPAGPGLLTAGITVAVNGALVREEGITGSPGQPARRRMTWRGLDSATTLPLTVAVVS